MTHAFALHTTADLQALVYEMHKDVYGTKGRHYLTATREECISWITCHYYQDATGCWCPVTPFDYDDFDLADREYYEDYTERLVADAIAEDRRTEAFFTICNHYQEGWA